MFREWKNSHVHSRWRALENTLMSMRVWQIPLYTISTCRTTYQYHPPYSLYQFLLFFILLTTTTVYILFTHFNFLLIKVFSSHVTLITNNLLDPVSYSYGSIFGYWHFQHIYTRSAKDKNKPKRKTFTYSAEWRWFFPVSSWPQLVWKKPIGYTHTFKLILFIQDNGYS